MKKTENKGMMMVIGIIICWITGAAICGAGYLIYEYFPFNSFLKVFLRITIPFIIGLSIHTMLYKRRNKNDKSNN